MTNVINAASGANASPPPVAQAPPQAAAASFTGGDFETFLKMLTTQISNQDPLNPMEGSDFAVQLATFLGVEQQVRTNQLLELLAGEQLGGLGSLADWIGKEVRTTSGVAYDGQPITLDLRPAATADRAELVAVDANGREMSRETVGLSTGEVDWAGGTADAPLPSGLYSFVLVSYRGDDVLGSEAVGAYSRVTGAELTREGVMLSLSGGATALESEVSALREPR